MRCIFQRWSDKEVQVVPDLVAKSSFHPKFTKIDFNLFKFQTFQELYQEFLKTLIENFDQSILVHSDYKRKDVKSNLHKLEIYLNFQGEAETIEWSQKSLSEDNRAHYDLICLKIV